MDDFRSIFARSASAVTTVWKLSATKFQGIHWPNYLCKNYWWGRPLLPEILSQSDRVGAKFEQ